jgi:acyl carrier protein
MTEAETEVFKRLQAIAKEIDLSFRIQNGMMDASSPMDIDSLEFMSLIIEIQNQFGIQLPDEEIQKSGLKVLRNLVHHLAAAASVEGKGAEHTPQ